MAEFGLFRPIYLAKSGVPIITKIDLTKPAAILNAITSELAPNALPVTGPTTKVTVPAPIVVMLTASVYPKMIATIAPTKKDKVTLNIREFNTYVNNDSRTENIILPLGDGLSVCRKL